jgi:hypothetical protein
MADVIAVFGQAFMENIFLFTTIIFAVLSVVPWVGLFLVNFFNHNVWAEIMATINRKLVKVFRIKQNGQSEMLFREKMADGKILLKRDKDTGIEETITPSTAPHPDALSHRHCYVVVEGQEGTKNLLKDAKYDVNTPQKTMVFTMAFEDGRAYERALTTPKPFWDLNNLIMMGVPTIGLILVLIMVYANNGLLSQIAKAVGVGA